VQQLGDDQVRDLVVDRRPQEDDPLVEQARVYPFDNFAVVTAR
jgi:hypothetical protein